MRIPGGRDVIAIAANESKCVALTAQTTRARRHAELTSTAGAYAHILSAARATSARRVPCVTMRSDVRIFLGRWSEWCDANGALARSIRRRTLLAAGLSRRYAMRRALLRLWWHLSLIHI